MSKRQRKYLTPGASGSADVNKAPYHCQSGRRAVTAIASEGPKPVFPPPILTITTPSHHSRALPSFPYPPGFPRRRESRRQGAPIGARSRASFPPRLSFVLIRIGLTQSDSLPLPYPLQRAIASEIPIPSLRRKPRHSGESRSPDTGRGLIPVTNLVMQVTGFRRKPE